MMSVLRRLSHPSRLSQRILQRGLQSSVLKLRHAPLDIHPEVQEALAHNRPVVALETALVTHGLPYPQRLEVPLAMEQNVRSTGAVPATIGLLDGRVKVGLERGELEKLADPTIKASKTSRRDIAAAVALGKNGGTTCSSTLIFSALAGIKVFATGGMGGVHRGGENSLDVSADLQELTRCPVALVSSGVKSILDIKRTLEYMETLGVPVIAWNETGDFPAFWSPKSGHKVPWSTNDPAVAANIIRTQWKLNMENGIMFAVPIPEEYHGEGEKLEEYVAQAIAESEANGMAKAGNDVTPWLLNRVRELSGGVSMESNIALLKNNALVGGQIAVRYSQLDAPSGTLAHEPQLLSDDTPRRSKDVEPVASISDSPPDKGPAKVVIVGCAAIDVVSQGKSDVSPSMSLHSTIPGTVTMTLGGVARNVAEAASRASVSAYQGLSSVLVAPIGNDFFGHILSEQTARLGMRNDGFVPLNVRTAVCNMVLDGQGGLIGGVADMDVTNDFTFDVFKYQLDTYKPQYIVFDGNLSAETIKNIADYCHEKGIKGNEPTSVYKSTRVLAAVAARIKSNAYDAPIAHFTPNILELQEVYEQATSEDYNLMNQDWWWKSIDNLSLGTSFRMDLDHLARRPVDDNDLSKGTLAFLTERGVAQRAVHLLPFFQHIWVKCGEHGVVAVMHIPADKVPASGFARQASNVARRCVVAHGMNGDIVVVKHFPALRIESVENVTGAGDSLVGTLIAGIASDRRSIYNLDGLETVVNTAQSAAVLTLQSHEAVSPRLSELKML